MNSDVYADLLWARGKHLNLTRSCLDARPNRPYFRSDADVGEEPQGEGRGLRGKGGASDGGEGRRGSLTGLLETFACPVCRERPTAPSTCECGAAGVRKRLREGQIGSLRRTTEFVHRQPTDKVPHQRPYVISSFR